MNIIKHEVKYRSRTEEFNLYGIGDIHVGSVGCDIKHLREVVDMVKNDPKALWIGMGDFVEAINITDKRFDPYSIDPCYNIRNLSRLVATQIDDVVGYLEPIRNKLIAFVIGNHEETVRLSFNTDVGFELSKRLIAPCLGYDGWIRLSFKRQRSNPLQEPSSTTYHIYVTHGHCGGGKSGGKVNKLEDICSFMDADLVLMGHGHKKVITPPIVKLGLTEGGALTTRKQLGVMTGSFLKTYVENATTYGEKKNYAPCDLGVVKITLKPDIHDIHAEI
jgi:predicted phosphodiesterase